MLHANHINGGGVLKTCLTEVREAWVSDATMRNGIIVDECGNKRHYINGKFHREDGPAVEYDDGSKAWVINGKLHREDGPAIEDADGSKTWVINDIAYSEEDYPRALTSYKHRLLSEILSSCP
jgi:hypothetical protein